MSPLVRVARRVTLQRHREARHYFPFTVPAIATLDDLVFSEGVNFFVGENGTGKSTLIEAIAIAAELPTIGSHDAATDPTLQPQRVLAGALKLSWSVRHRRGFFLRAEDLFGRLKWLAQNDARLEREGSLNASISPTAFSDDQQSDESAMPRYIGRHDCRSHGETLFDLFVDRIERGGLYVLDEPETALSPQRQIALLSLIRRRSQEGAQFIIATHSTILPACPDSRIFTFDSVPISIVDYTELDQVRLSRDFLTNPSGVLQRMGQEAFDLDGP